MKTAIFPGSFDPFTKGHFDIVMRSLDLFDRVIIAIGHNTQKNKRYFELEWMVDKINEAFANESRVEVEVYDELTASLAKRFDAKFMVRGLRNTTDFEYENSISQINRYLNDEPGNNLFNYLTGARSYQFKYYQGKFTVTVETSIRFCLMRYKLHSIILINMLFFSTGLTGQNFEGRLEYINYTVIEEDTVLSTKMIYWVKDHFYKHKGYLSGSFIDLGTLYADAKKMARANVDRKGTVERISSQVSSERQKMQLKLMDEEAHIMGRSCTIAHLIDKGSQEILSKIWISMEMQSLFMDQFAVLFEYKNTLFPTKGLDGWILKREDYRRNGEVFVTEIKHIEKIDIAMQEIAMTF